MNTTHTASTAPVRIAANYEVTKHLGNWTTAREFQVRAHRGHAVLDLRSPDIPDGEITIDVELDHAMLKLLVPDGAVVEDWDLRRLGRGRVKDAEGRERGRRQAHRAHRPAAARRDPRAPRRYRPAVGHVLPRVPCRPAAGARRGRVPDRGRPGPHRLITHHTGVCRHGGTPLRGASDDAETQGE